MQAKCKDFVVQQCTGSSLSNITHLRPGSDADNLQVVLFKESDGILDLGIIQGVFRGAKLKDSGGAEVPRRLRVTKPSAHALPCSSCARVRVVRLTKVQDCTFFACSLSVTRLRDPLGCLLGEIKPASIKASGGKLVLTFQESDLQGVEKLAKQADLLNPPDEEDGCKPVDAEPPSIECERRTFAPGDFGRHLQGSKNITDFMQLLAVIWQEKGMGFLTEQGELELVGWKKIRWDHLSRRAPEAFDVLLSGKNNKDFSRAVHSQFLQIMPDASESMSSLRMLAKKMDALAQPLLQPQLLTMFSTL